MKLERQQTESLRICELNDEKVTDLLQKFQEVMTEFMGLVVSENQALEEEIIKLRNEISALDNSVDEFVKKLEEHIANHPKPEEPEQPEEPEEPEQPEDPEIPTIPVEPDEPGRTYETSQLSLSNKSIAFLGDSLCEGYGWKKEIGDMSKNLGWAKVIQENNPTATIYNYAVGGSTYCWRNDAASIGSQMITMRNSICSRSYDYIILNGGINDTFMSTAIGSLSKSYVIPDSAGTGFYGGIEVMLYNFRRYWPEAKIGLILPTKTRWYVTQMNDRINMLEKICYKWNVPVLDLWRDAKLDPVKDEINNTYFYNKDGVHPMQAGYRQFLAPAIETWLKNGMPNQSRYSG